MRIFIFVLSLVLLIAFNAQAEKFCIPNVDFDTAPKVSKKKIELSKGVELRVTQILSSQNVGDIRIASNVICQRLSGIEYTGSETEWAKYIDNNVKQLLKSGHSNIQFTLVGSDEKEYQGDLFSIEYRFESEKDGQSQLLLNLAVLDKTKNIVSNFAVSGNKKAEAEIFQEYKRLLSSFKG